MFWVTPYIGCIYVSLIIVVETLKNENHKFI